MKNRFEKAIVVVADKSEVCAICGYSIVGNHLKMRKISTILTILTLIVLSTFIAHGQTVKPDTINLPCDKIVSNDMDTLTVLGQVVRYKIISTDKLYTKGTFDFYVSDILLPDFDNDSDKSMISKVLDKIGHFYHTDEFIAFKDCIAREIYYQAMYPLRGQKKYLKKNLIGHFKIEKK